MSASLAAFAVATPGTEAILADELAALGYPGKAIPGGVELSLAIADLLPLQRRTRIASKLLVRVGTLEAENFAQLRRRAAALPWSSFLTKATEVKLTTETHRCRLYHTGGIDENLRLAIADAKLPAGAGAAPEARLVVRGDHNRFTISIDASGELLHRRGYRTAVGDAPLRETLAAAVLRLAGYDGTMALLDPMCGSGSFLLEAAAIAAGVWPNTLRAMACQQWPLCRGLPDPTPPPARPLPAPIVGRDRDARALAAVRLNLAQAPFAAGVQLEVGSVDTARPPAERGLVVCNPPYGRRLGQQAEARATAKQLGRTLRQHFRGWRAAILLPAPIATSLGLRSDVVHPLSNGGLRVELHVLTVK